MKRGGWRAEPWYSSTKVRRRAGGSLHLAVVVEICRIYESIWWAQGTPRLRSASRMTSCRTWSKAVSNFWKGEQRILLFAMLLNRSGQRGWHRWCCSPVESRTDWWTPDRVRISANRWYSKYLHAVRQQVYQSIFWPVGGATILFILINRDCHAAASPQGCSSPWWLSWRDSSTINCNSSTANYKPYSIWLEWVDRRASFSWMYQFLL